VFSMAALAAFLSLHGGLRAEQPKNPVAIRHVGLFDSVRAVVRPGQTVVIHGEWIEAVGDDASVQVPEGSEVIDGTHMTLLPGLIDVHAHLASSAGIPFIASGVTTVRDMGNSMASLLKLKSTWDSGEEIGPWVLMAGPLATKGYRKAPAVESEAEARDLIELYKRKGYLQIKILDAEPQLVPFIVKKSHDLGMRVGGHVPRKMRAGAFIDDGIDELQHIPYLLENFAPDGLTGSSAAPSGAQLDLSSAPVIALIDTLRRNDIAVDPTVNVYEVSYGCNAPDYYRAIQELLLLLHNHGVTLELGSDRPRAPGRSLLREMEIWAAAGIPAAQILRYGTLGNARILGIDEDRGSIAPGKRADLVLVRGNPAEAISDIRRTELVIKSGVLFRIPSVSQLIQRETQN
jgi:imidazolonepropionase-like amidohydrolase